MEYFDNFIIYKNDNDLFLLIFNFYKNTIKCIFCLKSLNQYK